MAKFPLFSGLAMVGAVARLVATSLAASADTEPAVATSSGVGKKVA